ncbi:hypothetical protein HGM15179_020478 [Zosterops borbonicus]|uniref:ribonuclease H n=1 Tax=Zosterops borbonicus TaxID=364589 RepID=A0A8K1D686_9PASS|nr:hypothetical protein HGM15179_020478 [Zosterops borbonicus]
MEPSTSPWNTPVFCIKKKSGKWRLLQDLQKVNTVMESMGTLQAGMPLPTMLPAEWLVLVVDLNICFFTIPLHPNDRPKFAFSAPAINNAEPAKRYQWRVLPQGMRNSLSLCQWFVARALSGVRKQFPNAQFYHYMDEILVAASSQDELQRIRPQLIHTLHSHEVHRIDPSTVFVTTPDLHPTVIIGQWSDKWSDSLHVLEWVFLSHQPQKTATALFELIAHLIVKCRQRCLQLMGVNLAQIVLPGPWEDFDWSLANSVSLQSALENFTGQITYHLASHKLLQVAKSTQISFRPKSSQEPAQGPTIFTDGSGKTEKAIVTWKDGSKWKVLEGHEDGSVQLVELRAAVMAFQKFSQQPFNLIMDSACVADIAQQLGHSVLKEVINAALFHLLKTLWCAIQDRVHPYYVLHL